MNLLFKAALNFLIKGFYMYPFSHPMSQPNTTQLPDELYNTRLDRNMLQALSEMCPIPEDIKFGLNNWKQEVMQSYGVSDLDQVPYIKEEVEIIEQAYLACAKGHSVLEIGSEGKSLNYIQFLPDILDNTAFLIDHIYINNFDNLQKLPDSFGQLKGVSLFEVRYCGLTDLTNFLGEFQENNEHTLEHFDISGNKLTGMIPEWVFEFKNIELLQFSDNGFSELPGNFINIKKSEGSAKRLCIDGNDFEDIPDEILALEGWKIDHEDNPFSTPGDENYNEIMDICIREHNLL